MNIEKPTTDYEDARHLVRSGDMAVFNREGLISMMGRCGASHIGTLLWREADQDSLSIAESREGYGGRVVSLKHQVELHPGCIDIYTPNDDCPETLRERAATVAYNWAGYGYAYPVIGEMSLVHMPFAYWLARTCFRYDPDFENLLPSEWHAPKVCSQMHAWAYRWAKLELAGLLEYIESKPIAKLDVSELLRWRACLASGWDPCPNMGDRWIEPADLVRSGSYRCIAKGLVVSC